MWFNDFDFSLQFLGLERKLLTHFLLLIKNLVFYDFFLLLFKLLVKHN